MIAAFQKLCLLVGAVVVLIWVFNNLPVGQWLNDIGLFLQSVFSGFGSGGVG